MLCKIILSYIYEQGYFYTMLWFIVFWSNGFDFIKLDMVSTEVNPDFTIASVTLSDLEMKTHLILVAPLNTRYYGFDKKKMFDTILRSSNSSY